MVRELMRAAAAMGLRVHGAYLADDTLGYYSPDESRIYFGLRLTPNERRSVVAHELGHAYYGHTGDSAHNERQADIFAARLLIDPATYERLERENPDQYVLADEFNVTVDVIATYEQSCLTRLRGVTYAIPRMGTRQWALRSANG